MAANFSCKIRKAPCRTENASHARRHERRSGCSTVPLSFIALWPVTAACRRASASPALPDALSALAPQDGLQPVAIPLCPERRAYSFRSTCYVTMLMVSGFPAGVKYGFSRRGTVDADPSGPADTGSSRHIAPHPYVFSAVYDIDGLKSGAHHQMPQGRPVHEGAFQELCSDLPTQTAGGPPIGLMEIHRCGGQHLCQQSG